MEQRGVLYKFPDKVRVLPVKGLRRLSANKERRQATNLVGTVIFSEFGHLTKRPIYTVFLENGKTVHFFEDELEPAATNT